jgi:hypothetical protein
MIKLVIANHVRSVCTTIHPDGKNVTTALVQLHQVLTIAVACVVLVNLKTVLVVFVSYVKVDNMEIWPVQIRVNYVHLDGLLQKQIHFPVYLAIGVYIIRWKAVLM